TLPRGNVFAVQDTIADVRPVSTETPCGASFTLLDPDAARRDEDLAECALPSGDAMVPHEVDRRKGRSGIAPVPRTRRRLPPRDGHADPHAGKRRRVLRRSRPEWYI